MAALRYAARRILAGQASQSIYRAPFAKEQQRLFPTVIHGGSSTYPRRFSSMQRGEADPLTLEERIRICKRAANLIFRGAKAISTIVACGFAIKFSVTELFYPGYLWGEATSFLREYHAARREIESAKREALAAAKFEELKEELNRMLEDARREELMEVESNE